MCLIFNQNLTKTLYNLMNFLFNVFKYEYAEVYLKNIFAMNFKHTKDKHRCVGYSKILVNDCFLHINLFVL